MVDFLTGLIGGVINTGLTGGINTLIGSSAKLSAAPSYTNSLVATYNTKVANIQVFIGT